MRPPRVVLDTNVLVSAVRSRKGASFRLVSLVGTNRFEIAVSAPLVLEYEEVLLEQTRDTRLSSRDVRELVEYLCSVGRRQKIFFLWRPQLSDPDDEMVLELAAASASRYVVTFNRRHFVGIDRFGIEVVSPREFLTIIGERP